MKRRTKQAKLIEKQLAFQSLKANKQSNSFILLTIFLVTCLLMALFLYGFGRVAESQKESAGLFQATVHSNNRKALLQLTKDSEVEEAGIEALVQRYREKELAFTVTYCDDSVLDLRAIKVTGRLPVNDKEVAVSESYLQHMGLKTKTGQRLSLSLDGKRKQSYRVTGLIKMPRELSKNYQVIPSLASTQELFGSTPIPYQAVLRMRNTEGVPDSQVKQKIKDCVTAHGFNKKDFDYNDSYFAKFDFSMENLTWLIVPVLVIIIACAVVIYSLFYISVVQKISDYGRLHMLGMTRKQIKRMSCMQINILAMLGIPAGVGFGGVFGYLLVPGGWSWRGFVLSALIVVVIGMVTIRLSIRKPIKLAANVTPMEALQTVSTDKWTKTGHHSSKMLTPARLAWLNLIRNKKKMLLTMISLSFSGILVICSTAVISSIDVKGMYAELYNGVDFEIENYDDENEIGDSNKESNPFTEKRLDALKKNPKILAVTPLKTFNPKLIYSKSEEKPFESWCGGLSENDILERKKDFHLQGNSYQKLVDERGVIINLGTDLERLTGSDLKIGDSFTVQDKQGIKRRFKVMGTVTSREARYKTIPIYFPEGFLPQLSEKKNFIYSLDIDTKKADIAAVESFLNQVFDDAADIDILNVAKEEKFIEEGVNYTKKPLYFLVCFICLFSLISFINTLLTNLLSRKEELRMMRAVGLTSKQAGAELTWECGFYVSVTLLVTLTLGTLLSYVLCQIIDKLGILEKMTYHFPLPEMVGFAGILLLILTVYYVLVQRYCRKLPLLENEMNVY